MMVNGTAVVNRIAKTATSQTGDQEKRLQKGQYPKGSSSLFALQFLTRSGVLLLQVH